jgi:23S rRNA (guanine745-N1)-methyltransferase
VPSAVPRSLACVAGWLRCPVCSQPLAPAVGALTCSRGHSYDVAREGYVTLFATGVSHAFGDDAGMVAARAKVERAGQFEPLTAALVQAAGAVAGAGTSFVLDVGAGTGRHLAGVLGALPQARGVALDASRPAARSAARAHESIAAVRADAWRQIPLGNRAVDLALNVFAPRNGPELGRVVRPGGTVLSVTPAAMHFHELATLHSIRIDPDKTARLHRELGPWFKPISVRLITWTLQFTSEQAAAVLRMGPAARHLRPDFDRRLPALGEPIRVTAAARLRVFRRGA